MYIENYLGRLVRVRGRCAATPNTWITLSDLTLAINYAGLGAAAKLDVTSSSASDKAGQVGAIKLLILGLDASYNFQAETISLNGTTIVQTTKSFLRVFAAEVLTAGTSLGNVGTIYIIKTGSSAVYTTPGIPDTLTSGWLEIGATLGMGTSGIFTVPLGCSYGIKKLDGASVGQIADIGVWRHCSTDANDSALKIDLPFKVGTGLPRALDNLDPISEIFPEKTDLYLRAKAAAATTDVDLNVWLERRTGVDINLGYLLNL
jgi:hypothetical protein